MKEGKRTREGERKEGRRKRDRQTESGRMTLVLRKISVCQASLPPCTPAPHLYSDNSVTLL